MPFVALEELQLGFGDYKFLTDGLHDKVEVGVYQAGTKCRVHVVSFE